MSFVTLKYRVRMSRLLFVLAGRERDPFWRSYQSGVAGATRDNDDDCHCQGLKAQGLHDKRTLFKGSSGRLKSSCPEMQRDSGPFEASPAILVRARIRLHRQRENARSLRTKRTEVEFMLTPGILTVWGLRWCDNFECLKRERCSTLYSLMSKHTWQ